MPRCYAKCNNAYTLFQSREHLDDSSAMTDHPDQEVVEIPDVDDMKPARLRRVNENVRVEGEDAGLCISFITGKIHNRDDYDLLHPTNEDLHPVDDIFGALQALQLK